MSYGLAPSDPLAILDELDRRITHLERFITAPSSANATVIVKDPNSGNIITISQAVSPPSDVVVVPGAAQNSIWGDVYWQAPGDQTAVVYEVSWAQDNGDGTYSLAQFSRTSATSFRIYGLLPNQKYVVTVSSVNILNQYARFPISSSEYVKFTTTVDAVAPPAVSNVSLAVGATAVIVQFTPLTAQQAADVANGAGFYQVDLSTDPAFGTIYRTMRSPAYIVAFNDIVTSQTLYARVAAIDSSGNQGPWAMSTSSITGGGVIDSMLVADFSAAHFGFGTMKGARIEANTLKADRITTSKLITANLTLAGGSLTAGNPPTTGLIINSQGLRLYSGGVIQMALDAGSGVANFYGALNGNTITGATIIGSEFWCTNGGTQVGFIPSANSLHPQYGSADLIFVAGGFTNNFGTLYTLGQNGQFWINANSTPTNNVGLISLFESTYTTNPAAPPQNTHQSTSQFFSGPQSFYSSRSLKKNIQNTKLDMTKLDGLKIHKFRWKDSDVGWHYGVIAEAAQQLVPEAVSETSNGLGVSLVHLATWALAGHQERERRILALERAL